MSSEVQTRHQARYRLQIALQLDGPSQFFSAPPFPPLGGTLLQWHLLLKEHWKVNDDTPLHLPLPAPSVAYHVSWRHM